jgi:hypothetical protein
MPRFFPNHAVEIKLEEPQVFRRLSFSLAEMAIVTGVLVRILRLIALTHGSNNWFYLAIVIAVGSVLLLGMLTAHLANYPLRDYLWRAPLFALIEVTAEMGTSALLIALGREANGTVRAHWDDLVGMALHALLYRGVAIVVWGLILAGVVQLVRRTIVHEDDEPNKVPTS